jgi:hypothetical protein
MVVRLAPFNNEGFVYDDWNENEIESITYVMIVVMMIISVIVAVVAIRKYFERKSELK